MGCEHKNLQRCEMGPSVFYRCTECHDNFTVKPLEITVELPAAPGIPVPMNTDLAE